MIGLKRRTWLAAAATLPAGLAWRKPAEAQAGKAVPDIRFTLADGTVRSLADYAGHAVVLNLWATWCAPCVAEMPSLSRLAALVQPTALVLPLSSDRGGAAVVERFFRDHAVDNLPVLLDPRGDAARSLGVKGIPTTLLIDAAGRERGRMEGDANWASPESVAMVRALAR